MTAEPTPEEVSTEAIDEMLNGVLEAAVDGLIDGAANAIEDRAAQLRMLHNDNARSISELGERIASLSAANAELDAEIEALDRAAALIRSTRVG